MQPNGVSSVQDLLALGPIRGSEIHGETHGVECCKVMFGESKNFVGERGGGPIPVAPNSKSLLISEAHKFIQRGIFAQCKWCSVNGNR